LIVEDYGGDGLSGGPIQHREPLVRLRDNINNTILKHFNPILAEVSNIASAPPAGNRAVDKNIPAVR